jgi:hypothetical protein
MIRFPRVYRKKSLRAEIPRHNTETIDFTN